MWINANTLVVYNYIHEIRLANPEVSLPEFPSDADFEALEVFPVAQTIPPSYNQVTQDYREITPVKNGDTWEQQFEVYDLDAEQYAERIEQIKTLIVQQTQHRLDTFAKTRNYDGILSLCTYATSGVPKFQAEGQYGVTSRDATWDKLYTIMSEIEAGTRPMPTGYSEIEGELPVLVWPNEITTMKETA